MKFGVSTNLEKRYPKWFLELFKLEVEPITVYDGVQVGRRKVNSPEALADESLLIREFGGPWNFESWSRLGTRGKGGMKAILKQAEEIRGSRPDMSCLGMFPVLGEVSTVVDIGTNYLDETLPPIRAGLQHTRIYRWLGEDEGDE